MPNPSALVDATIALLEADARLTVFDGQADDGQDPPWVQVYADPGFRESSAWAMESDRVELTFTTVCVGASARASRLVADWTIAALLHVTPAVDGWKCHPILQGSGRATREDHDVAGLWTTVPTWRVRAFTEPTP